MYQDGLLSPTEMGALQKICTELKERPVRVLRSLNIVSQPEIQGLLQEFYGVGICTQELLENLTEDHADLVPQDLAVSCSCVGISDADGKLTVLLEDPSDLSQLEKLEFFLEKRILYVVATAIQVSEALQKVYGVKAEDQRLTTVLEASRGLIGGRAYDPSQLTEFARHDDLLVDQNEKIETLRNLLSGGLAGRLSKASAALDFVKTAPDPGSAGSASGRSAPRHTDIQMGLGDKRDPIESEARDEASSITLAKSLMAEPDPVDLDSDRFESSPLDLDSDRFESSPLDLDSDRFESSPLDLDSDRIEPSLETREPEFENSLSSPDLSEATDPLERQPQGAKSQEAEPPSFLEFTLPRAFLNAVPKLLHQLSKITDPHEMIEVLNSVQATSELSFHLDEGGHVTIQNLEFGESLNLKFGQELPERLTPVKPLVRMVWKSFKLARAG